jgi:signal transduction histidine kinase
MSALSPPDKVLTPAVLFVGRLALAWGLSVAAIGMLTALVARGSIPGNFFLVFFAMTMAVAVGVGITHVNRVRGIAGRADESTLSNRQRRQIEVPCAANEAFDIVESAIRALPRVERVDADRALLKIRAEVPSWPSAPSTGSSMDGRTVNLVTATLENADECGSVLIVCEPRQGAWIDWFFVDDGHNLETAEMLSRSIARMVADRRRAELAESKQTAAEKELADARLKLLQAQVEPHFLYNTLANAQLLTRSDPARADKMLGELISYLRCSLPRADAGPSTLSDEVERSKAYLELMKIRMGERLKVEVDVAEDAATVALPSMILQTLVENAIKHGLEPKPGGGTIWIRGKIMDDKLEVQVADDGKGFGNATSGSGIGLKNAKERLRMAYGEAASLGIAPNYPCGVTATVRVPLNQQGSQE